SRANTKGDDAAKGMNGEDPDMLRKDLLEVLKSLPKEAGEIEATAVTSWALALESTDEHCKRLTLRLAKNRRGPAGQWIPLMFSGRTGRIDDAPSRYAEALQEDR